ncbi:MAG: DUF4126 domain-containing protein [Gemmatimonadetes bacterium]|nr:DUF4126 domain-containing protein [Gemmatimonadota bacterium]
MELPLLGLALTSALTAGINLYATVLVLGLLHRFDVVGLPGDLSMLADPWVLGAAGFLYAVEFVADKVPWVDSLWDAVHTFIRVPAGAAIAWGAAAGLEPGQQMALGLAGGTLALAGHGTKLSVRAGANTSPEPFSNWFLSIAEDVFVVASTIVAATSPLLALVIVVLFVIAAAAFFMVIGRALKRVFGRAFGTGPPVAAPPG